MDSSLMTTEPTVATVTKTFTATPRKEPKAAQPDKVVEQKKKVSSSISRRKKNIGPIRENWNVLVSSVISSMVAFQVGVYQAKTEVAPKYLETKQQVITLTDTVNKKDETIKDVAIEKAKITAEVNSIKKSTISDIRKYYLRLIHPDGRYELRTGGSPSWRYNNPGKLLFGNFAKNNGAIGNDGPLAIFGSYEDGMKALDTYLFQSDFGFKTLKLSELITDYYSKEDGYNPKEILAAILKETGLSSSQVLMSMNVDERTKLLEAMQNQDFYVAGNIVIYNNKQEFEESGY